MWRLFNFRNRSNLNSNNRRSYDILNVDEDMFVNASEEDNRRYVFKFLREIADRKHSQIKIYEKRFRRIEILLIIMGVFILLLSPEAWAKYLIPFLKIIF